MTRTPGPVPRSARLAVLFAAVLSLPALAKDREVPVERAPRCRKQLTPEMERQQREADELTAASLKAELRRRGLVQVTLPEEEIGQGYESPGAVVSGSDGADRLVTGHSETPSDAEPPMVLVEDRQHQLFVVDLAPRVVADKTYLVCGCGPPGSGAYMPRTFGVRLPKGQPLKGHLSVAYSAKRVAVDWTRTMPDGSPCAMPP